MNIDAKEAVKRMCALNETVAAHLRYEHPTDCFCGHGGFWGAERYDGTVEGGYRNDGVTIEFIATAVAEKIQREKDGAGGRVSITVELAEAILDAAEECCDEGPIGEGWKSNELTQSIAEFKNAIDAVKGVV